MSTVGHENEKKRKEFIRKFLTSIHFLVMKYSWSYKERDTSVSNKEAGRLIHSTGSVLRFDRLYFPKIVDASATADGTDEV